MVKKEVLVRIQTLAIGCKKTKNGFTLLELLVVLMIIGISTTLIIINSDLSSTFIKKNSTYERTFNYLSEESILTGKIIGWYINENDEWSNYINFDGTSDNKSRITKMPSTNTISTNYKKTFKYFDGIEIDISKDSGQIPLIIFYPSGENSGGILKIFKSELIEEIIIKKNGTIETRISEY